MVVRLIDLFEAVIEHRQLEYSASLQTTLNKLNCRCRALEMASLTYAEDKTRSKPMDPGVYFQKQSLAIFAFKISRTP